MSNNQQSFGQSEALAQRPRVVSWFKVYAGFLCLPLLLSGALCWILATQGTAWPLAHFAMYVLSLGSFVLAAGAILLIFTAPKPFHWPLGLVLICVGFAVPVLIPACIALIIFWRKPEAWDYFRK
jgi:hypothetical protein